MITIPLFMFFFAYVLFLAVVLTFFLVNSSHLVSGGSLTMTSFSVTALVLCAAIAVVLGTWAALEGADWRMPVIIGSTEWFSSWFSL